MKKETACKQKTKKIYKLDYQRQQPDLINRERMIKKEK